MLYEQYYQKTLKWAAVLAAIKRFRVLIICIACAIAAALAAFMGVYGIVYSSPECSSEIVYGEALDYDAKALFSKVSYEYTPAGEEAWSAEFPELAGDYEVRSVAKSIFGTSRYGEVYAFTILPREIEVICEAETTYGEDPSVNADIADGDSLQCASFTYGDIVTGRTTVEADKGSITIYNGKGTDVTSNYIITTVQSDILIVQRTIAVTFEDGEKTYDGTALTNLNYDITEGSLAYSDGITITGGTAVTTAGTAANTADIAIYSQSGEDVTECYDIQVTAGTLTVNKRVLYVTAGSAVWTYDGTDQFTKEFTLTAADGETGLVDGQTVTAVGYSTACDVGEYENTLEFEITDTDGNVVTESYDIVQQTGTLTVEKRAITVTSGDYSRVYDGTAFHKGEYTLTGSIADGQAAIVDSYAEITDVGSCENTISLSIYGGQSDVTANYDITYKYGTLTVTKRQVILASSSYEWIYDGLAHSCTEYTTVSNLSLADGQQLQVTESSSIVNAGTVQNVFTGYGVIDGGGADVTANYTLTFESWGTLTVTRRAVTFITGYGSWEYDGEEHSCTQFEVSTDRGRGLADGQTALAAGYASITDVGKINNSLIINIYSGDENVTENYNITYEEGTLTVTQRTLTVTAGSDTKYYDGISLTCATYSADRLVSGHNLTAAVKGTQTAAGTCANVVNESSITITDANGGSVIANYSITCVDGTLTVKPRPVTIQTGTYSWVYDGEEHSYAQYSVLSYSQSGSGAGESNYGLLTNLSHSVSVTGDAAAITDAGSCRNVLAVAIYGAESYASSYTQSDVTADYDITFIYGTLTVTKRPVTLLTGSGSWVYDGEYHSDESYTVTEGSFVSGHEFAATAYTTIHYVGSVSNNFTDYIIYNGGTDVTENYDVTITCGTLTVTKLQITICTGSYEREYDGSELYYAYAWLSDNSANDLPADHEIVVTAYTAVTDAGSYENILTIQIQRAFYYGTEDETANFDIIYDYGTLTITPREIAVTTGSAEKVYDGTALTCSEISADRLLEGHTITAEFSGTQTDPGISDNTIAEGSVKVYDAGGADVTGNYTVTGYLYGTLTVYAGTLTVYAGSAGKIYDGTALTYNNFTYDGLVENSGHIVTAVVEGSQTDVGSSKNIVTSVTVTDAGGEVLPGYYYIVVCVDGELTVSARSVIISTGSGSWTYDGEEHYSNVYAVSSTTSVSGIADGQNVQLGATYAVTNVGSYDNKLTVAIYDGEGSDVTANYSVTYSYGTLTITERPVYVISASHTWLYEGLTHSDTGWELDGELVSGHYIVVTKYTDITDAGTADNALSINIYDEYGGNVTANYEVTYSYGTLEVFSPLELTRYESYNYDVEVYGYYTFTLESGSVTLTVNGTDVYTLDTDAAEQEILLEQGDVVAIRALKPCEVTLSYSAESADDSGGGSGAAGGLDTSGDIGSGVLGSGDSVLLTVTSDTSGSLYLKLMSYGNYNGRSWSTASDYEYCIDINGTSYSLSYLVSLALADAGVASSQVTIQLYVGNYVLPYYTSVNGGDYDIQTSDVYYTGTGSTYTLNVYYYDYLTYIADGLTLSDAYAQIELAYRTYVYTNYLSVPASTLAYLETVIEEQGFDSITDKNALIAAVVNYVQNAATYNLEYDRTLDSEEDIVVAFLSSYKEGICQHYASAATLLFRALGIPARYTIGFHADTTAGEAVDVSLGHAWTEIYIDGLGWVQLEVTGSGSSGSGGGSGGSGDSEGGSSTDPGEYDYTLYIKPADETKTYDGTPLTASDIEGTYGYYYYFRELINKGYTYTVQFSGSQTDPGVGSSAIMSFTLYDPNGTDVTGEYNIIYVNGTLTVTEDVVVTVYLYAFSKEYDGTPLSYSDGDYYWQVGDYYLSATGYDVVIDGLSGISITDYGTLSEDMLDSLVITVYKDGVDVTDLVTVVLDNDSLLTVYRRSLSVTAASVQKEYDGTALTDGSYRISGGSLADGDYLEVLIEGSITDIGETENVIIGVIVYNSEGVDVTDNYDITTVNGTLTITSD